MSEPFEGFREYKDEWTNGQPFTLDPFIFLPEDHIILLENARNNEHRAEMMKEALQEIHERHLNKPE